MCDFCEAKWDGGTWGSPGGEVTWRFADPGEGGGDVTAAVSGPFAARTRDAFDAWESVVDLDFTQVRPGRDADIIVGWGDVDGPYGVIGYARTSYLGDTLVGSVIVMDLGDRWSADRDHASSVARGEWNFYAVMAHEIGHAIGLPHLDARGSLMHATSLDATDLTLADVRAGVALYGPATSAPAGGGDDVLAGSTRSDFLRGGRGDDALHAFGGADQLKGGKGHDRLAGGRGPDDLIGGHGHDRLAGGRGSDDLNGGAGRDALLGGRGGDALKGGLARDRLRGEIGDDRLDGGFGPDRLRGDRGDDRLDGGAGRDVLHGGRGADVFVLAARGGRDVALDWRDRVDKVELEGGGRFRDLDVRRDDGDLILSWRGAELVLEDAADDRFTWRDVIF